MAMVAAPSAPEVTADATRTRDQSLARNRLVSALLRTGTSETSPKQREATGRGCLGLLEADVAPARRAASSQPDDPGLQRDLGLLLLLIADASVRAGESDNAAKFATGPADVLRALVKQYPNRRDVRSDLGSALFVRSQAASAVERVRDDLRECIELLEAANPDGQPGISPRASVF